MWKNYFNNIQKKYSMRVSKTLPLVIRLDGKDVTKNKSINLLDRESKDSFTNALENSVKYFTEKYNCFSIFGSDEVSFIFDNPNFILEDMTNDSCNSSNEIISGFSQYFFKYFNEFDEHKVVYWHGKCFSIQEDKIKSYIKYRSRIIQNVMTTYFLIKQGKYRENEKLENRINKCGSLEGYDVFKDIERGILYYNGAKIDLDKFLDGQIEEVNKINIENLFSDLEE